MDEEKEAVKTAEALAAMDSPTKPEEEKEEQPVEETETSEKSEQTPEETQEAPEAPDAKAFQAQRRRIKELEEQLNSRTANTEPLVPRIESPAPQVQLGEVNQNNFFDSSTGEFDAVGYQNAVRSEAIRAATEITNQRLEEEKQTAEAYIAFPELNPQDKSFDQDLYDATSAILLQSMVKGQKVTAKQAAEKALGLSKKALKEASDKGAQQQLEQIAAKEAASLEATANSGRANQDFSDIELLSEKTRRGGDDGNEALAERIKRSGF